jgi:hypothetical protein
MKSFDINNNLKTRIDEKKRIDREREREGENLARI